MTPLKVAPAPTMESVSAAPLMPFSTTLPVPAKPLM